MADGTIISANAAYTVRLATNTSITTSGKYAGTRGTSISATQHPKDVILYYKCKNAVTITSCSKFDGVEISYTSVYSGDGSDPNPYQLVNCSFTGNCACHYLKSYSSNGCSACNGSTSGRFMAVSTTQLYDGTHAYHREATCRYCPDGEYFEMGYCNTCPDGGTSVSPTSTEQKTACYLPSGTSFSNTTGKGTHTGNCKWEN